MARERLKVTAPVADLRLFGSRAELVENLADTVAGALTDAILRRGTAFLAVSGGSTPGPFFRALSQKPIAWDKVTVTLVDERLVPPESDRSNERLARTNLLQNQAAKAQFAGLYLGLADAGEAAAAASEALASLPWPLDAVILGMGGDGHTASFFPDARTLDGLLDPRNAATVAPVDAPSAGEPRLTLTMARLIEAPLLVLHIEGAEKRKVLEAALAEGSDLPIASVLNAAPSPVQVYWAP